MVWLADSEKLDDMLAVFIQYQRLADRQTNGQTDRQTSYNSIVRSVHSIAR